MVHPNPRAIAALIALLLAVGGCRRDRPQTPPAAEGHGSVPAPVPASMDLDETGLFFHRTGGFVGTDDRIVVWPDGLVQWRGTLVGQGERELRGDESRALSEVLIDWPSIVRWDESQRARRIPINDAFHVTITYAGQTITTQDGLDEPRTLRELQQILATLPRADETPEASER